MSIAFSPLRRFASTSASVSTPSTSESFYKITLIRSTIGLAPPYRAATQTLGLHRLHKTVYYPVSPTAAGLILKLKELLKVETVSRVPTLEEVRVERKAERGYRVVKKGGFT